ncbi:hypothetical protein EV07_1764 [Prochlorococcus sp. MIT 0603]|nr:hypothetical protein EV07_1764 [Prochlorococcus sp. MIT 0603]
MPRTVFAWELDASQENDKVELFYVYLNSLDFLPIEVDNY